MKKTKLLRVIIVIVLLASILCTSAFAAPGRGGKGGNKHGGPSCSMMGGRCADKSLDKLERMVEDANARIEQLVAHAQATPKNDVDWLLRQVDKVVDGVMDYAAKIGATVLCEYTEYYIDGQYVLIDPLRVVNF